MLFGEIEGDLIRDPPKIGVEEESHLISDSPDPPKTPHGAELLLNQRRGGLVSDHLLRNVAHVDEVLPLSVALELRQHVEQSAS